MRGWPGGLLAVVALGALPGCAVRTVDCWQLNGAQLADARASGRCEDAFARNIEEIVPFGATDRRPGTATVARPPDSGASEKPAAKKPPANRKKRSQDVR